MAKCLTAAASKNTLTSFVIRYSMSQNAKALYSNLEWVYKNRVITDGTKYLYEPLLGNRWS